ncbi:MAG: hypothetical protein ACR2NU_08640, partial [Aeoliella sp.]
MRACTRKEASPIIAWLVNTCWFFFKWGILLMLVAVVAIGGYFYLRLDDEIRRYAEHFLAEHYGDLDVRVGSARFEPGRGVTLRHLSLAARGTQDNPQPLVDIDEMQLVGQFDVESLIAGKPEIKEIIVRGPHVQATRSASGDWNLRALTPPPPTSEKPAALKIVDASVTFTDHRYPAAKPFTLRGVQLDVTSEQANIVTAPGQPTERAYRVEGSVAGALSESFLFHGRFQPAGPQFEVGAQIAGLEVTPALLRSLPGIDPAILDRGELTGKANLRISATRRGEAPVTWTAEFDLAEGRISIDGLPRQVTNLTVVGSANENQLNVKDARARYGKSDLVLACTRYGWQRNAPLGMRAAASQLALDENLADALPDSLAKVWYRFRPAGQAGASLVLRYNGQDLHPDLTVHCHDVSFEDREKFPYRVRQGHGTVRFFDQGDGEGGQLHVDLQAQAGDRPVTITARLTKVPCLEGHPCPPPLGLIEVKGKSLATSDDLTNALPEKSAKVVRSLDPRGRFSMRWSSNRTDAHDKPRIEADLTFHDCQLRYEKFPYPLSHVNGRAQLREGNWRFDDLVSNNPNGSKKVHCQGTCDKTAEGHLLSLMFTDCEVGLDDTLRLALSQEHQQTWAALRPSGRVGFRAKVVHHSGDPKPNVLLEVHPLAGSVSVNPTFFPYRLSKLAGAITMEGGNVTIKDLRAAHGQTTIATDATWVRTPHGGWQFDLTNLLVDRLTANNDLVLASPLGLRKVIESVKPEGSFSIHNGKLRFTRVVAGSTHLRSEWNVQLGCQQNDLEVGVPLDNVSGVVHLAGRHEGNTMFTAGQLDIDSLFWNGIQLTNIRGPIWVDNEECRVGGGATQRLNQIQKRDEPQQRVEANLYGGRFAIDANVRLDTLGRYTVEGMLDNADLHRMSTEYFGGSEELSGNMSGKATLTGSGKSLDLLEGGGWLAIRDAQMYELPIMARLLKVLRNRVPDKTAFNGVDAEFALDGKEVSFAKLNLLGDA